MDAAIVKYTQLKPAEACRYDNVALGEIMLRFDPFDVPTPMAHEMRVYQGGGETNVACGLSYAFGLRTAVLTALVDDAIGCSIRNQLRTMGVDTSWIIWFNTRRDGSRFSTDQKGTLGNGIMITYVGRGLLPSETLYYRAHTPVRELATGDIDWTRLFGQEGVRVFSTGGIYSLLSPTSWALAREGMQQAAAHGVFVTADLNYRSKVEPDRKRAQQINRALVPYIGFLVGNDSDLSDALGYDTRPAAGTGFDDWFEAYCETVRRLVYDYPNLSLVGTQWRGATNADLISWGAVLYDATSDTFYKAPLRHDVPIADRTGGGDSFASGVLAALLKGHDLQTAVEWGAAHGILVQETPGDTTMVDERVVMAEVKRARAKGGVKAQR